MPNNVNHAQNPHNPHPVQNPSNPVPTATNRPVQVNSTQNSTWAGNPLKTPTGVFDGNGVQVNNSAQNPTWTGNPSKTASTGVLDGNGVQINSSAQNPAWTGNPSKTASTGSLDGDDVQVLPKPITNEEFQAMIPAHFLHKPQNSEPNTQNVTVTVKRPDPIELPPSPTGPGRVTETITKSTFTETVVTRITDNKLVVPVIVEV